MNIKWSYVPIVRLSGARIESRQKGSTMALSLPHKAAVVLSTQATNTFNKSNEDKNANDRKCESHCQ